MLSAKKNALEKTTAMDLVALQQQEMDLYYNNFTSLATMATLVAGFSFESISLDEERSELYLMFATCAIGLNMSTAVGCVFVNIHGSGLALHGKQGSLARAVRLMSKSQAIFVTMFTLGVVSFMLTLCVYCGLVSNGPKSFLVSIVRRACGNVVPPRTHPPEIVPRVARVRRRRSRARGDGVPPRTHSPKIVQRVARVRVRVGRVASAARPPAPRACGSCRAVARASAPAHDCSGLATTLSPPRARGLPPSLSPLRF